MITLRRSEERGHANHGWLDAHHTFSFADYYDPRHQGFRSLRVINDDTVAGGGGFPMHAHRDMEIITYILSGALEHRDSMGNGRVLQPGDVQYMAAGSGVKHSEFNHSPLEPVHLLQIWIRPRQPGATPRYEDRALATAEPGRLHLVASGDGRENSIAINQDADLWLGILRPGDRVGHALRPHRHAWVHVAEGEATVNGHRLRSGDAAALNEETAIDVEAHADTRILVFDLD